MLKNLMKSTKNNPHCSLIGISFHLYMMQYSVYLSLLSDATSFENQRIDLEIWIMVLS